MKGNPIIYLWFESVLNFFSFQFFSTCYWQAGPSVILKSIQVILHNPRHNLSWSTDDFYTLSSSQLLRIQRAINLETLLKTSWFQIVPLFVFVFAISNGIQTMVDFFLLPPPSINCSLSSCPHVVLKVSPFNLTPDTLTLM